MPEWVSVQEALASCAHAHVHELANTRGVEKHFDGNAHTVCG